MGVSASENLDTVETSIQGGFIERHETARGTGRCGEFAFMLCASLRANFEDPTLM